MRARRDLVEHRVAAANQLRAHLQIVFPGVVGLFAAPGLPHQPGLPRAVHHPGQGRLAHPDPARRTGWPRSATPATPPRGPARPAARPHPRGTTDTDAEAHAATTLAFVAVLRTLNTQIDALADSIAEQLDVHPDAHIVTSLPRSGTLRAARLLAEIGDARGRFPTADSLACLAGVAPSTRQSGKVKAVTFRWSADQPTPRRAVRLRRRLPTTPTPGPPTSTTR